MTTTRLFETPAEEIKSLELRHTVNELAYREGRITGPQFIACRDRLRARMEEILFPAG